MTALVRAELAKIRTLRSTWVLVALAAVFCAGWTTSAVLVFDATPQAVALPAAERLAAIYRMGQQGYLAALLLGVFGMTGEYRHQTITWTFLQSPVRRRVLVAKAAAHALFGLGIGLLGVAVTTGTAAVLLSSAGRVVFTAQVPAILAGCVLSTAGYALLGLAIGTLVRNQAAAVAVAFGWFYYGEYLLAAFLPVVGRWLPTGAAKALIGDQAVTGGELLPVWAGAAVFLGYVVVIGGAAQVLTLRRDVT
ncbi:hypothetical protein [Pseudonocardia sp. GCM10023141]|uniref:hypothetical protein n=1 Tax=Pseudonocardia sp. GCM10023141 TaxID=3252653 RepID=UPI003621080D